MNSSFTFQSLRSHLTGHGMPPDSETDRPPPDPTQQEGAPSQGTSKLNLLVANLACRDPRIAQNAVSHFDPPDLRAGRAGDARSGSRELARDGRAQCCDSVPEEATSSRWSALLPHRTSAAEQHLARPDWARKQAAPSASRATALPLLSTYPRRRPHSPSLVGDRAYAIHAPPLCIASTQRRTPSSLPTAHRLDGGRRWL